MGEMTKKPTVPAIRFKGFTDTWEQRKFSDVVATRRGLTYKPSDIRKNGVRVLRSSNIAEDSFVLSDEDVFVVREAVNIDCVRANDILITAANGSSRLVGKHTIISGIPEESAVHGGFMLLGTTKEPHFVNASMGSSWYRRFIELFVAGGNGAIGNLNKNDLDNQDIAIPSEKEQKKIGSFFRQLDNLITLHQRKLDKLHKVKRSLLERMFPRNGANVPEIRFSGFTGAWEQRKFSELTEIRSASRVHKEEWKSSGVPFYRSSDVMAALNGTENEKAFISEELYEKLTAVSGKLEKGDVLVTGGGSVGKPYIVANNEPLYTKDADLLWIKNNEYLDPYFVYTFFFSQTFTDYLNSVSHVGTIAHYTITQLGETPITLPCVSEQQKIGDYFRNLDSLITLHQRKLDKLRQIKRSMLEKMFV